MFNYYFLVADTDLCLSVAKLQVTRVPEVFWSQIPISACMLQSSQVTRVPKVFMLQILISVCLLQSYKLPEFQKFFGRRVTRVLEYPGFKSDLFLFNSKFPSF